MHNWLTAHLPFLLFAGACVIAFGIQYGWLHRAGRARLPWLTWLLAALLLVVGWRLSEQAGQRELSHIQSVTQDFARLYADEMERLGHWKLPSDAAADDPLYLQLVEKEKNWERLNPDVSDIYTLRKLPNGKSVFIVDSETDYNRNGKYDEVREQRTPVGEIYDVVDEGLERAFSGQANFDFVPITDRWGTWVSAYVPLHDPAGRVEAVLGVDFDAHEFIAAISGAKLRFLGFLAVLELLLLGASTLNVMLRIRIGEREKTEQELKWKTAFLEAQVNSSSEGVLVVDDHGKKILQNRRTTELLSLPQPIAEAVDDAPQLQWIAGMTKNPGQFFEKVLYLNAHRDEISHDEIELKDGTLLDRYSSPVLGRDGKYYGRIWTFRDITGRKRAEAALIESKRFLRSTLDALSAHIAILDENGVVIEVNAAWRRFAAENSFVGGHGLGDNYLQVCDSTVGNFSKEAPAVAAGIRSVMRGERDEFHLEYSCPSPGQPRWFVVRITRFDGDGPARVVVAHENITQRKLAENDLRESNEKFHQLADNIADVFWIRSPDLSELHYVSPAFERIWGRPVASLYANPQHWPDFIVAEDRERVLGAFAALKDNVRSLDIEYRIMRPRGEICWVRVRGFQVRDAAGKLIRHAGIVTDITERKRAERQLNIQNAINRVLAESSTAEQASPKILQAVGDNFGWDVSSLWSVDSRENVLRCVEIWSRPGIPMDPFKAASRQMTFALHVGLPGRVWANAEPAWIVDVINDANFSRASAANEVGLHTACAFPILSGNSVSGVIEFISREVREVDEDVLSALAMVGSQLGQFFQRRHLENQLFQSQKLETVGKLAGGIAHEFNSILTAIIGQGELLLEEIPVGSPLAGNAGEIIKAASRAATLTRQLLAYGRKQFLRPETLNLNQVITGMNGVLGHLLGGEKVEVKIIPAPGLHWVKADAGQIEQVIMNLAINARDAMPNGGRLTLETANVTFAEAQVGHHPELKPGNYVMLAISDNGAGMSPEVKARVFEPFFSTKEVGQGTGLGLSTCYGIIKQSGGHINVYSEPGRGTTFKIYLPQAETLAQPLLARLDALELSRGTETILLVEDDPALREMAAGLLKRLGYTVWTAANGVEALSLSHQPGLGRIDLLFTDVVMPHMGGNELASRMRALYPKTRMLFTSAYTENAILNQGVLDKGVVLLQKPFTPSALAAKVRQVLDQP